MDIAQKSYLYKALKVGKDLPTETNVELESGTMRPAVGLIGRLILSIKIIKSLRFFVGICNQSIAYAELISFSL